MLVVSTLLWGGCVSCEQYFMLGKSHGCCNPDGHCKRKPPSEGKSGALCSQIAFDHQKSIGVQFGLPVTTQTAFELRAPEIVVLAKRRTNRPADPSPPDLHLLHSVFLI
jgi:hypothetical protein